MNLLMIGAQGSGKGTQGELLAREYRLKPSASGELLRAAIAAGTPAGQAARPYYERGDLVPDEIIVAMFLEDIQQLDGYRGILMDGFPRTIPQARALDESLAKHGQAMDCAIYLDVPREQLIQRLSGRYICRLRGHVWNLATHPPRVPGTCDFDGSELYQRSDDTGEAVERRLDIFFNETIHVAEHYEAQGKLLRVNGAGGIEEVHQAILAGLTARGLAPDAPSAARLAAEQAVERAAG
jgi:adenylate kinase